MANLLGISMGFLASLRRNQRGNALMLVAAGLIPMLGLIGGGVDMSRLYLTKSRVQQACDAGALAGRKAMGGNAWSANGNAANTAALAMFDANFVNNAYGTGTRSRSYTENAGTVSGTASVIVPMTVMRVFGQSSKTIAVTCQAEMRIPNSDVMFVLDNTGSMADCPNGTNCNSGPGSKIVGLRAAVKCFYEALAKLDTDEDCGSTPSGGNSSTVQLRFGFVPYDVNVNVGRLLKNEWMADRWTFQSRIPILGTPTARASSTNSGTTWASYANFGAAYTNVSDQNACNTYVPAAAADSTTGAESAPFNQTYTGKSRDFPVNQVVDFDVTVPYKTESYRGTYTSKTKTCQIQYRTGTYTQTRKYTNFVSYRYQPEELDVSGLKAGGSTWNTGTTLPWGARGVLASSTWDGCIQERKTWRADSTPANDYNPIPASAYDMDIDMVPSADVETQWGPAMDDAIWGRYTGTNSAEANWTISPVETAAELSKNTRNAACPVAQARKLTVYNDPAVFDAYVDTMVKGANTYHDIGLIWGARLLSPTGLFASENAQTPSGGEIQRHLIFMTDGETATSYKNITAQGVPWWDRKQSDPANPPTDRNLTDNVNARTQAICTAIKNKNITLWVISFGSGVSASANTLLQNCASPGRFYTAASSSDLIDQFRAIADNISALRLTN